MSNTLQKSEPSLVTDFTSHCTDERTYKVYAVPGIGPVRCRSLKYGELVQIRTVPAELQYAAGVALIVVDEHGDTTHVLDDETLTTLANMDAKTFDFFVDILNNTVLNKLNVDDAVKN